MTRQTTTKGAMRLVRASMAACGLWLAGTGSATAQGLDLGVKGGLSLASIRIDTEDPPATDWRSGLVAGGFLVVPMPWFLEAQVECLYTAKGTRLTDRGVQSTLLLEYLEVPVLARVTFGRRDRGFHVAAGPTFAARLRARTRVDIGSAVEEIDVSDEVESVDAGMAVGGGYTRGRLMVEGRYTFGMREVDAEASSLVSMRNAAISVTAGLRF